MDIATAFIGIGSITLCALPFVITSKNKKKKEKQLLNSLKDFAKKYDSVLTQHETGENYAIGLDTSKNIVYFLNKTEEKENFQFIDLATIKNSEINNISKSLNNNEKTLDRLNLKLNAIDKKKPSIVLEFYNSDISYLPINEFDSIEKWNKIINNLLINKQQNRAA